MASRGTTKYWSVKQEKEIAQAYKGVRSKSSGAAAHDGGDVRTDISLIECKYSGSPGEPLKSKPKILSDFEKITQEAWSEGREPVLALRYYWPNSPLANIEGWIDLSIRRTSDDVENELDSRNYL